MTPSYKFPVSFQQLNYLFLSDSAVRVCVTQETSPPITEQSSLLLPPVLILHDPHSYPSPFCCFAACVDVYGTHSNVHLRCFHTGKSTAPRCRSVTPESYQCHWAVVITLISLVIVSSCPAFPLMAVCFRADSRPLDTFYLFCMWSSVSWWYQCAHNHLHSDLSDWCKPFDFDSSEFLKAVSIT